MAPPPAQLMEELVEEILLRIPQDDPASLVRAALVCKLWCRFVGGAAFRRRFRELHRGAAPMLGLLYGVYCKIRRDDRPVSKRVNLVHVKQVPIAYFVPATSFRPAHAADGHYGWRAIDACHGRVLLYRMDPRVPGALGDLCVWHPVTNEKRDLPEPPFYLNIAAVACAATAGGGDCDHLDCCRGPFLVVAMGVQYDDHMYLSVYSSEAGTWSKVTLCKEGPSANFNIMYNKMPGVLVRSALYILVTCNHNMIVNHKIDMIVNHEIVKYNLATQQLSTIHLPSKFRHWKRSIKVMTDDDGGLGFVANVKNKLQLWSRVAGADGDASFELRRVIDLRKVLPSGALNNKKKQLQVIGCADGGASRVLFIRTSDGLLYSIEINSSQVNKVANCCGYDDVIPYISFCTPTSRLQHLDIPPGVMRN